MNEQNPIVRAWEEAGRPHPFATFRDGYVAAQSSPTDELVAARDMLDDARMELDMLRQTLGISIEPHQNLFDRMLEAAKKGSEAHPDAQRYRALRIACATDDQEFVDVLGNHVLDGCIPTEAEFDAAVDAARAAKEWS